MTEASSALPRWTRPDSVYQKIGREHNRHHHEDVRRASAVAQWTLIVGTWPSSFVIVRQCRDQGGAVHPSTLERSIDFALAPKATNTIVRRLGAFTAFVDYAVSEGQSPFPMSENSVFRYLDHMHTSNAAPSKASSFLQCLNWMGSAPGYHP